MKVKVAQNCLTLYDPMDYTVHGILQARILEWVAFPFSRGSSQPRDPRSPPLQADSLPAEPPGKSKNTGVGSLSLLQRTFPTQESNQGLLHCGQILYQLSYQESPRVRCKNTTSQTQLSQGFLLMETFTCHSWNSTNVYIFQKLCTFG